MLGAFVASLLAVFALMASCTQLSAQSDTKEPGWSMVGIQIAAACGADPTDIELAAMYVEQWGQRNLPDPSRLTKEKVVKFAQNNEDIKQTIKQKGVYILPCSKWVEMLNMIIESKGAVMGGNTPPEDTSSSQLSSQEGIWANAGGKCAFRIAPKTGPFDSIYISFQGNEGTTLELSGWINAKGLAALGRKSRGCRFYEDVAGVVTLEGQKFASRQTASTACRTDGDGIGAASQSLEIVKVGGNDKVEKTLRAIISDDNLAFVLSAGPKSGQAIQIPIKGLREAIKKITVCPAPIMHATAN